MLAVSIVIAVPAFFFLGFCSTLPERLSSASVGAQKEQSFTTYLRGKSLRTVVLGCRSQSPPLLSTECPQTKLLTSLGLGLLCELRVLPTSQCWVGDETRYHTASLVAALSQLLNNWFQEKNPFLKKKAFRKRNSLCSVNSSYSFPTISYGSTGENEIHFLPRA